MMEPNPRCSLVHACRRPQEIPVDAHDTVVALRADETRLIAVVGPRVLVVLDTRSEMDSLPDGGPVEIAVKVHPFAAVR